MVNLKKKNVEIIQELSVQDWGKNIRIKDINGFELEFWAELKQN